MKMSYQSAIFVVLSLMKFSRKTKQNKTWREGSQPTSWLANSTVSGLLI